MRLIGVVVAVGLFVAPLTVMAQQVERQTFGGWTAQCEVDKMSDAKKCLVFSKPLFFGFTNGHLSIVIIGTKHYPGSQVMLRIDDEPPLSGQQPGFTGGQATKIMERCATDAQRIRTRYREWPTGSFVEGELSPKGFADALAYVRSASGVEAPPSKAPQ